MRELTDAQRARNLAHCDEVMAEADRAHSPQELADAAAALSVAPDAMQPALNLAVA